MASKARCMLLRSILLTCCILPIVLNCGCRGSKHIHGIAFAADNRIQFVDVTAAAGIHYRWLIPGSRPINILQGLGWGCAFLDYNNDGNLDILLVGTTLALYKGDGHGHFTDVTHETGLDKLHGYFMGCAVGDYDNDGYDDLYISGYKTGFLLHNEAEGEKGRKGEGERSEQSKIENRKSKIPDTRVFRDVTKEAGIKPQPWGTSAAFGDIDGDGKLDLYIGNYVEFGPDSPQLCGGSACSPTYYRALKGVLYRNLGGGRFEDVTRKWGAQHSHGKTLGVAFADYDGSGRQSLMVANDEMPGDLFKNLGHQFTDIGSQAGVAYKGDGAVQAGMGLDWGDYDNDGRLDLTITNFEKEAKPIYHNDGADIFSDRSSALGVASKTILTLSFGVKWLDVTNNGWLDLIIANGHVIDNIAEHEPGRTYKQLPQLFRNDGGVRFTEVSARVGPGLQRPIVGRGLAIGDFDNDGRTDVLIVDADGAPLLLHNESAPVGHWLTLSLEGVKSNRDGYGALVTVGGGRTQADTSVSCRRLV